MRNINFKVNQQRIKNKDSVAHIYGGTDNYLNLVFDFDDSWKDCLIGISFGDKEIVKLVENNSCTVPEEAFDETKLTFYLVGKRKDGYRIQSQKFMIRLGV